MISIKFDIKSTSDNDYINNKCKQYSYAYRKMYRNFNMLNNDDFRNQIKIKYNLNETEYRSIKSEIETKVSQTKTNKSNLENEIICLENDIKILRNKLNRTKKETRVLFKLDRKLKRKNKSLSNDIVFGSRMLLKEITHLHNKIRNNINDNDLKLKLETKLAEYRTKRILPIYVLGEANQSSNRFFSFDFKNNIIIYKPNKNTKIRIEICNQRNKEKILLRLQELIDSKQIPITVYLSNKSISISYNDKIINDYELNIKERNIDVEKIKNLVIDKELRTELIKKVYSDHYKELENRKLLNKKQNRCMGIDLNPDHIGISILDRNGNDFKIIHTRCFDFTYLGVKLPKEASQKQRTKKNNKKKYVICNVWKEIFNIFKYYNCGYLAIEQLNLKSKDLGSREANRKINNIWHRTLTMQLIDKYCNNYGISIREVIPVYSSLIGNLYFNYIDPVNASIEIARRGLFKYDKGKLYLPIDYDTIMNTMSRINNIDLRDVSFLKGIESWKEIYKLLKESGLRYRACLDDVSHHKYVSKLSHVGLCNIGFNPINT